MSTLFYLIREGARGFFQAKLMTFVSIVTIGAVLFVAAVITVVLLTLWEQLGRAVERSDFVVYLTDAAAGDSAAVARLAEQVRGLPQIGGAAFVGKEEALQRFAAMYGSDMLDAVDGNPLPASLELTVKKEFLAKNGPAELKAALEALPGVDAVRYARDWLDFLTRFQQWFFYVAVAAAAIMVLTLHITISNTIRLTIYARRELVRYMQLVGATRSFVAMPFIIEGMLQGLIGGSISVLLFYAVKAVFVFEAPLRAVPVAWGPPALPAIFLFLGVIFGWIGSLAAVRKFLA
jgi:cell division transport system permease protein